MTNAELKAAIVAAVYENTEGAITGDALQDILLKIVDQFEVPTFDLEALGGTDITGTLAECAAAAGVSENMFLRLCNGDVPVVILKQCFSGVVTFVNSALGAYTHTGGPCIYRSFLYDDADQTIRWIDDGVEFKDNGGGSFSFKCVRE